jgi:hypothetical protein
MKYKVIEGRSSEMDKMPSGDIGKGGTEIRAARKRLLLTPSVRARE